MKATPEPKRALVVLGDMNVREDEVEALRDRLSLQDALYHGQSWDPKMNRY